MPEPTFVIQRKDQLFLSFTTNGGGMRLTWSSRKDDATEMDRATADTLRGRLYPVQATDQGWTVQPGQMVCTGVSARWCPICGDCTCRPKCDGCRVRMKAID